MADIRDLFLERAVLYFYEKQIDPSFRLMLPQCKIFCDHIYIDIRQKIFEAVCIYIHSSPCVWRGIAWCGTLCGMARCGMLCGMPCGMTRYALWDGMVRFAIWNGEVCYVAWHGAVYYVAWHGMICYVAWYVECFGMVYDVVYYMIWYGIWCMHICMRVLCVNTAETTGGNYWQPKPQFKSQIKCIDKNPLFHPSKWSFTPGQTAPWLVRNL